MLVPRTAANQVPKSGQWGVLAHFRAKLTKILKQTLFAGQRLTTRFIEAHAEVVRLSSRQSRSTEITPKSSVAASPAPGLQRTRRGRARPRLSGLSHLEKSPIFPATICA